MHSNLTRSVLLSALFAASVTAQSHLVVPAAYANQDAISFNWLPGASRDVRQQTLVGAAHLTPMLGETITAIEWRRSAKNEVFQGGVANLTVTLSIAPHDTLDATSWFAANVGPAPIVVFSGQVTLPTSPADPGPNVAWTADNVVRVPLTTPFLYNGGTLCVDVVGAPVPGLNADWWMADAMFEDLPGTVVDLGGGCGTYGGPANTWSHVETRSLVAGGYAHFYAYGPPLELAIAAFGIGTPIGVPLNTLGFQSPPNCDLHLAVLDTLVPAILIPDPNPFLASAGGRADFEFKLPGVPAILGAQMTTQWLEWSQMATSNALQWTVAGTMPTLDMALLEGDPSEPNGNLTVHLAHVLRFEHN